MPLPRQNPFLHGRPHGDSLHATVAPFAAVALGIVMSGVVAATGACGGGEAPVTAEVIQKVAPSASEPSAPVPTVTSKAAGDPPPPNNR